MPSFRFCRPDDIPYLVRAINECFLVHFSGRAAMTVERFRDEMKSIDLWPSNSMVVSSNRGPVAVMTATKREHAVLVTRVGVHPEHRGRGHGRHLLTSLSQKLAVLGPERLEVELPAALADRRGFFEACSYSPDRVFTDWVRPARAAEPVPEGWLQPITVAELDQLGLLSSPEPRAWSRSATTLRNRADELTGFAIASPERLEAFALAHLGPDRIDLLALEAAEGERAALFLGLLVRHLAAGELPLRLPSLAPGEVAADWLDRWGFRPGETTERLLARATPG